MGITASLVIYLIGVFLTWRLIGTADCWERDSKGNLEGPEIWLVLWIGIGWPLFWSGWVLCQLVKRISRWEP